MKLLNEGRYKTVDFPLDKVMEEGLRDFLKVLHEWRVGGLFLDDKPLYLLFVAMEIRVEEILKRKKTTVVD